jgi:PAS domain S-box-containing protein
MSNLPGMVYRCENDPKWTMQFVSDGCRELTGYEPADLTGNRRVAYGDLIVPADRAGVWDAVQTAIARRGSFEIRYRITTASGGEKWVWERGLGIFGAGGRLERLEGFITDVTAAVCAEQELQTSENRLALVFNASRDMMCLVKVDPGPAFRVVSVNAEYVRTVQRAGFALTAADLVGHLLDEWRAIFRFPEEAWRLLVIRYRRVVETRQPLHYEELTETPAGTFYGDTWLTPVASRETGEVEFVLYTSTDVTDRVRAEKALAENQRTLSAILDNSFQFIGLLATDGRLLRANQTSLGAIGARLEDVQGKYFWATPWWTHAAAEQARLRDAVDRAARGEFIRFETTHPAADGRLLTIDFSLTPVRDDDSRVIFLIPEGRDITELKRIEAALRSSEEKFSKAFRASPDAISVSDLETGQILDVNEGFERAIGYTRAEIVGRTSIELQLWTAPEDRERIRSELRARGSVRDMPVTARMRDGRERCFLLAAEPVEIGGRPCLVIISRDITEQRLAEQALRESEEKFSKAFLSSPDALTITELDTGRYLDVNVGFERISGHARRDVIGRTALEVGIWASLADRAAFLQEVREKRTLRDKELRFVTRDGQPIITRCSADLIEVGGTVCLLNVIRDITAERRAEETRAALETQLRQAQKLEALGQLAGGIAHDFNNILTGILAYAELATLDAARPDQVRKHLGAVKLASERAGNLVRQILTFSRRQAPERKPTQLAAVVEEALKLLRSTLPKTIEIVEEMGAAAPPVLADATQIHQVVMNLCTNAAHAMSDRPGRLTVRLAAADTLAMGDQAPPGIEPGRHARLTIEDTGRGMDAATLGHIFEPFFTTKAPGEGTGLGLAVVHGIVEEHDGVITVRSTPDEGTTFDVYLPEFTEFADSGSAHEEPLPRGRGQRVLFVDDETVIGRAIQQLLERLGYRATVHSDPREAWTAFDAAPAAFDVVVTDLTMPHWTGIELARRILARRPDTPVILTTGHSGTWTPFGIQALGIRTMICKPLTSAKLAIELHAVLAAIKPEAFPS